MKVCSICKTEKDLSEFGPKGKNKDGSQRFESRCKDCKNRINREKYKENADLINLRRKAARRENLDEYNKKQKEYYWKKRDHYVTLQRKRYSESEELRNKHNERVQKYRDKNKEKIAQYKKEYQAQWRIQNREKIRAHRLVQSAILNGTLDKLKNCELCHIECDTQGHHEDYSKPLNVIWLCSKCHSAIHRLNRRKNHGKSRKNS